eukprot:CAMPEP_0204344780 /NCGR_PEP_ID=MMETSP0469-20131031/25880_1 /ASSEMBLY_ACC=CAM_ASM_000384 /TAXON_ID=2969 /ORGANISM="Oxyrrhis marina" /LENGTH=179 /DNA_ID=CAMNT_0051330093 /DNA_START=32 /DNA_END=571 /DNA_ORIENTATION=-
MVGHSPAEQRSEIHDASTQGDEGDTTSGWADSEGGLSEDEESPRKILTPAEADHLEAMLLCGDMVYKRSNTVGAGPLADARRPLHAGRPSRPRGDAPPAPTGPPAPWVEEIAPGGIPEPEAQQAMPPVPRGLPPHAMTPPKPVGPPPGGVFRIVEPDSPARATFHCLRPSRTMGVNARV